MTDPDAFLKFEKEWHDRLAMSYDDFFAPVTERAIDPLLDAVAMAPGDAVLDVATGPGTGAGRAAARAAGRVVGVDLSRAMLAVAAARHPSVDFREADAERLPFADATFDAVVCNFGVGHFPRPETAADEFVRVLKPGGRAALSWWDFTGGARLNGVFLDAVTAAGVSAPANLPAGPPVTRFSHADTLRALLERSGLADVIVGDHRWVVRVESADAWWRGGLGSMVRVAALVLTQPDDVQRRIRAAFEDLAAAYRAGDRFDVPMAAKVAAGRKPG